MFEQALYTKIKQGFKLKDIVLDFGYGEIGTEVQAPYIVQYSLDMDGTRQVLCNEDDFTDGKTFAQWNIYALTSSNADYIAQELFKFINGLDIVEDYVIRLKLYQSTQNINVVDNGLSISIVAMQISYTKIEKEI